MIQQQAIPVTHVSQVGEVRRAAAAIAAEIRLGDTHAGRVGIIINELGNNLVRYAKDGLILLRGHTSPAGAASLEILALDHGPGMDPHRCLDDGFSTGGTPGNGLGAVRRLASEFDVYSSPGTATAMLARISNSPTPPSTLFRSGIVNLPARGEFVCGDTCRLDFSDRLARLMIADGLGHGPDAAKASTPAAAVFDDHPAASDPAEFLRASHAAMSGTRGSALAIAALDARTATLRYGGVGNIAGVLFSDNSRRGMPSMNGIVGAMLPRLHTFDYPLPASGTLVMHSDGLQTRWSLDPYPGLLARHPALIAGILYRDFYRGRDDVSVIVASWREGLS